MFLWLVGRLRQISAHFLRVLLEEEEVQLEFPGTWADLQARAAYFRGRGRRERVTPLSLTAWALKADERSGRLELRVNRALLGVFSYHNLYVFRGVITGQDSGKRTLLAEGALRWKPFGRGFTFLWFLFVVLWTLFVSSAFLLWGLGILFENDICGPRFALLIPAGLLLLVFGVVNARLMVFLNRGGKRLLVAKLKELGFRLLAD